MSKSRSSKFWTGFAFALSILTVGFAIWLFANRQFALDQLTVWTFQPSASVKALNESTQFTDQGRFIFYATKPVVAEPDEFNNKCPRQEKGSPVLGCYTSDDRIYVYNVKNAELDGMKEVTAAHEMLHAVWQRMSEQQREDIGKLMTEAYEKQATPELRDRMAYYERNEPDAITNELHSILGTEVADLGAGLESYYARFFKNRQVILDLHAKYDAVYKALYNRADTLFSEMSLLSSDIETRSAAYDTNVSQLTNDINSFNARANGGSFSNINQFYAERAALVKRSSDLEAERVTINNNIVKYNVLYEEYQTIASQIEVLNSSIDSFKALGETPTVK